MPKDKFMVLVGEGIKHKSGARHLRRAADKKLKKLAKRFPAETAAAMKRIEEKLK